MTFLQQLVSFFLRSNSSNTNITTNNSKRILIPDKCTANDETTDQQEQAQPLHIPSSYAGLEQYKLLERLGDGAFSIVYEALNLQTQEKVAIKIIRKLDLNSGQRFKVLREVELMRSFEHDSIISLYDFIETDKFYFLILELCQGGELFHQIIHLTYFSEDLARHCIWQIAEGIRYLHEEMGVVHRDIKPENLLFEPIPFIERNRAQVLQPQDDDAEEPKVDEGGFLLNYGGGGIGKVKIADFGLSKTIWDQGTRTPCGTSDYLAPEIVRGEQYSKSVDIWALGCVLYTMLCGFPPFFDESIDILTEKIANGQYSFLSPWWDFISDDAKDLISHALCLDPNDRYDIHQFMQHPWMTINQKLGTKEELSKAVGDILMPPSTTTSVAIETIAATKPWTIPNNSNNNASTTCLFETTVTSMKGLIDMSGQIHRKLEEESHIKEKQHRLGIFFGCASNDSGTDEDGNDSDDDDDDIYSINDTPRDEITLTNDDTSHAIHYTPQYNKNRIESVNDKASSSSSTCNNTNDILTTSSSFDDLTLVPTLTPDHSNQKRPRHSNKKTNKHDQKANSHSSVTKVTTRPFDLDLNKATLIGRRKEKSADFIPVMPLVRIN